MEKQTLVEELENEVIRLNNLIKVKDRRIEDLLDIKTELVGSLENSLSKQCRCDNLKK